MCVLGVTQCHGKVQPVLDKQGTQVVQVLTTKFYLTLGSGEFCLRKQKEEKSSFCC